MRDIPGYPSDRSVVVPDGAVTVSGRDWPVESVSITREVPSSLPAQVHYVDGITAATGDVVLSPLADAGTEVRSPWTTGTPTPGARVSVDLGYLDATGRAFTGVVDSVSGSVADGTARLALVDHLDRLDRPFTMDALLPRMPPLGAATTWRGVNLTPTYVTDRLLRAAGLYATPPRQDRCVFSAPLMGSTWAELGTTQSSAAAGAAGSNTSFGTAPWGQAADSADVTWTPNLSAVSGVLTGTVQLSCLIGPTRPSPAGSIIFAAYWGANAALRLVVTSGRNVHAQVLSSGSATTICTLSAAQIASTDTMLMRVTSAGNVALRAGNGAVATGSASIPSVITSTVMTSIRLTTPSLTAPVIGGLQINFANTLVQEWARTAVLTPSAYRYGLEAVPAVKDGNILDLLREQAASELAGMWIDEDGVFHWANRSWLESQNPAATLTAVDDLTDIGWEHSLASLRSSVVVESVMPAVSRSTTTRRTVWQGPSETLETGEVSVRFAESPADESWVMVDEAPRMVGVTGFEDFNRGRGSWVGGIRDNGSTELWAHLNNPRFSVTVTRIGVEKYLIETDPGSPGVGYDVTTRTPSADVNSELWLKWRNENLPILRAKAHVQWTDFSTPSAELGPSAAPMMRHDVGWWIQAPQALSALAGDMAALMAAPIPVLTDLQVVPDTRLQLCDVVWVEDAVKTRSRLRVLVTGIRTALSEGSMTQSISGRVIEAQRLTATLTEHDAVWVSDTLTGHDGFWSGSTLTQHDADPLRHP